MKQIIKPLKINKRVSEHKKIKQVENLMIKWVQIQMFKDCYKESIADDLLRRTVFHTYVFGKYTLPSYGMHIFGTLRKLPPANNKLGKILSSLTKMIKGELFTNNIFNEREVHAHYHDIKKSYLETKNNKDDTEKIIESKEFEKYLKTVEKTTKDPLSCFLITLVSEETICEGYKIILDNLSTLNKYQSWRIFMEKHIFLDTHDHGPITVDWLNYYLEKIDVHDEEIDLAINNTIKFLKERIKTYS